MKKIYLVLLLSVLFSEAIFAQYESLQNFFSNVYSVSIHTGYSQVYKKNDAFATTSNVGGVKTLVNVNSNSSSSQNSNSQEKTGKADGVPLNIEFAKYALLGDYRLFSFGVEYQTFLQRPVFYVPIRGTTDLAYKETFNSHSGGFFLKYLANNGADIRLTPQIGFGKRWNFDKIAYSEKYKSMNLDVENVSKRLRSSFYVSTALGASIYIGNRTQIEFFGRYFPIDFYEEVNSISKTKLIHWQGTIGIRKIIGDPCKC